MVFLCDKNNKRWDSSEIEWATTRVWSEKKTLFCQFYIKLMAESLILSCCEKFLQIYNNEQL